MFYKLMLAYKNPILLCGTSPEHARRQKETRISSRQRETNNDESSRRDDERASRLVDLLDRGAVLGRAAARCATREAARCAAGEATGCAARRAVELLHDGVGDALELLLLVLVLLLRGLLRRVEPRDRVGVGRPSRA